MELSIGTPVTAALVVLLGYLFGALPLADRLSRRHGVDIFSSGTGLAGASNVRRSVGNAPALVVLMGDMCKGATAVVMARFWGIEGSLLLLPVAAAILGHWFSVFSGFRGGDGLATLGGAVVVLFPTIGIMSLAAGILVQISAQKMPYSSLIGVVFAYAALAVLSYPYSDDAWLLLGVGALVVLVLVYALNGHRRRNSSRFRSDEEEWNELGGDDLEIVEHSGTK